MFIIVIVTLQLFQVFSPSSADTTIGEFVTKKLDLASSIDVSYIESIIWFLLLGLTLRYFQTCTSLDHQYSYLNMVEENLCRIFRGEVFTREGKYYLNDYPLFSSWAHFLYSWILPLILIVVVVNKLIHEIINADSLSVLLAVNITFGVFVVVSTVLYLVGRHGLQNREERTRKRHQPKMATK